MKGNSSDIKYLFEPRSVAIVGASHDKGKIGYKLTENIVKSGYKGKIYPINPKGGEVCGNVAYATLEDVPGSIDMAVIVIPAKYTYDAVQQCASKNVKHLVIITSGFSEVGNIDEEKKIVKFANEHGMRVLGPNIFGVYSAMGSINATFGPSDVKAGHVALLTQSGALGIAMFGKTKAENIGLSAVVSIGNKADLNEADLLDYLVEDENTKVILLYIEGVKDGQRFVEALKRTTCKKPVVVIKSGRSKKGAMAAASHTGSLAGADDVFSDVMAQTGVLRAENIQEALNWCKFLSTAPIPNGDNTVIITNGGGVGVMAADACEKFNVSLYEDQQQLKKMFTDLVPSFGSVKNPVDITGGASVPDYEKIVNVALDNPDIHSVICLGCETALFDTDILARTLERTYRERGNKKPIVFSFIGGAELEACIAGLRAKGVPVYSELYDGISALGAVYSNYRNLKEFAEHRGEQAVPKVDVAKMNEIVDKVLADHRHFLLAHEAAELMLAAGINMPQSRVAHNMDEAVKYAEQMGYPLVMKVVSKDIIHKSDAGGVALDLENKEEVMDAYQAIIHNCRKYKPDAKISGIEVCEMIQKGTEVIIGARQDGSFGPVVMFGLGGIYVEVMKDVSFRALPVDKKETMAMIEEIRSYPLLLGVRGEKRKDIDGVVDTIMKVGAILQNCDRITDIEVNPLVVYEQGLGVRAVDARILLKK
jgi:acetate---CoA ligase (ADP-forming)